MWYWAVDAGKRWARAEPIWTVSSRFDMSHRDRAREGHLSMRRNPSAGGGGQAYD
jgi:hypothetical protein